MTGSHRNPNPGLDPGPGPSPDPVTVTVVDETTSGERRAGGECAVPGERPTLRELIRSRALQEAADSPEQPGPGQPGSGQPGPEERCALALAAFERNGFLVLVGERQVEDLDERLDLRSDPEVTFLRLVPLAGG